MGKHILVSKTVSNLRQKMPRLKLYIADYRVLRNQALKRTDGAANFAGVTIARPPHEIKQTGRRVAESDYLVREVSEAA
jgi:hypothetical protein